ncbi:MAG TPA: carbonic anhydrase family protein [Candidatus Acidoferrales bacterium]
MFAPSTKLALASSVFCTALLFPHLAGAQSKPSEPQWGYAGADGPDHWGDLDSSFAACKAGTRQSPIDIKDATESPDLAPIRFDYKLSPLKIVNNGQTIRVDYEVGSGIVVNGISFPLTQFHFHHRSETEIDGQKFDMELHLVHQDPAAGRIAVVAILIKSGAENALLRDLLSHAPSKVGEEVEKKKVVINAAGFLPADQNYYVFDGSLTTPPCSEGVRWYVLKQPIEASPWQIAAFAKLYPNNARPVEPLNGRTLLQSDFHK